MVKLKITRKKQLNMFGKHREESLTGVSWWRRNRLQIKLVSLAPGRSYRMLLAFYTECLYVGKHFGLYSMMHEKLWKFWSRESYIHLHLLKFWCLFCGKPTEEEHLRDREVRVTWVSSKWRKYTKLRLFFEGKAILLLFRLWGTGSKMALDRVRWVETILLLTIFW